MRKKLKPEQDLEYIQSDLIETVCYNYKNGVSVRALAKQMELSPMKTRKILITGGVYSTDLSTEIGELYQDGKTVGEIAELLDTTPANVNSYLPYERIIYNMEDRSVEADRQARYRERLRSGMEKKEPEKRVIERVRDKTMIIVIGQKLRKILPKEIFDDTSDPLARDKPYTWGGYENGEFVIHEAPDPDKMIWCAELTSNGRGKGKKSGIVLMSANCGFAVICPVPSFTPSDSDHPTQAEISDYREISEKTMLDAIRDGFLTFAIPEDKVLDYTDTVRRIELVKGRRSTPGVRLEQLIEQELKWDKEVDPVEKFNVRGNWTDRKFGNGDYRFPPMLIQHQTPGVLYREKPQVQQFDWGIFPEICDVVPQSHSRIQPVDTVKPMLCTKRLQRGLSEIAQQR